ncbi:MAG: hypothetical protein HYX82_05870 [Chloroflexi bacterium]|nr:hypothetical protein [Chloroflexota bacterium]
MRINFYARHKGVDFDKNRGGGIYGLKFTMTKDQARVFSKAIKTATSRLSKLNKGGIEVNVRWGAKNRKLGFLLVVHII